MSLIQIGESIHASIPKPAAAMKELMRSGAEAFEQSGEALAYILTLIDEQIEHQADYLEINVDALAEGDREGAIELMCGLIGLVRREGQGVPVCIDSSDDEILIAGLHEWYKDAGAERALPLVNSIKPYTMNRMFALREQYPYKAICLLMDEQTGGADCSVCGPEQLHEMARTMFKEAITYGFEADDLFFDTTVFPLAIDMPMLPGTPGYTYRAFEAVRLIMNDPEMKGVHTSLGLTNCIKDMPARRIGICRAYLAAARGYGLDGAIVNVMHDYEQKPPDQELIELIMTFARQDGSPELTQIAMDKMGEFCRENRQVAS